MSERRPPATPHSSKHIGLQPIEPSKACADPLLCVTATAQLPRCTCRTSMWLAKLLPFPQTAGMQRPFTAVVGVNDGLWPFADVDAAHTQSKNETIRDARALAQQFEQLKFVSAFHSLTRPLSRLQRCYWKPTISDVLQIDFAPSHIAACRYLRAVRLITADMPPWEVPSCSSSSSSTIVRSWRSWNASSNMARV
jgi:hypothetical protein